MAAGRRRMDGGESRANREHTGSGVLVSVFAGHADCDHDVIDRRNLKFVHADPAVELQT